MPTGRVNLARIVWRTLVPVALSCVLASPGRSAQPLPVEPVASRIDAVVGRELLVPVRVADERRLARLPSIRLDDGRSIDAQVWWIGVDPPGADAAGPSWLPTPGRWRAIRADAARAADARPPGRWYLRLPLPLDAVGQGVWMGNTRLELNWLPDPIAIGADRWSGDRPPPGLWDAPLPERARGDAQLVEMLEIDASVPDRRWRARLALDGLRPAGPLGAPRYEGPIRSFEAIRAELGAELGADPESGRVLEHLARQTEARWQVALGLLWDADPEIARQVIDRLAGVAEVRRDVFAPMWNVDARANAELRRDLLSPFANAPARATRARAWIEGFPRAIAWVVDDGGRQDAGDGVLLPTLGVISLPRDRVAVALEVEGTSRRPGLSPLPPRVLRYVQAGVMPLESVIGGPVLRVSSISVRIGRWTSTIEAVATLAAARPPGLRIGPLLHDWTMNALSRGANAEHARPPPERATVAMLSRATPIADRDIRSGWVLYAECHLPEGVVPELDTLRVWLGPYDAPTSALRITPDGSVIDELAGRTGLPERRFAETRVLDDRWVAELEIPREAVSADGILRLGVERLDDAGRRTAWPRRMLPWQIEPGRLAIDLTTWSGMSPDWSTRGRSADD